MSSPRLEEQLSTLQLLQAMYPLPSELKLSSETEAFLGQVQDDPSARPSFRALRATLSLQVEGAEADEPLRLNIELPVSADPEAPAIAVSLRQPGWLNRSAFEDLCGRLPDIGSSSSSDYLLPLLEALAEDARSIYQEQLSSSKLEEQPLAPTRTAVLVGKPERVWFWFPSLSSKEKRRDLVTFAEEADLTGFVLAGKPGLLCVEGDGRAIDRYMARIKSESWSDIPSYQKKVTERLRRPLTSMEARSFRAMTDITDSIPHYGQYNHRGEMGEVRRLMDEWGVGEDFGTVVMNAGC